MPPPLTHEQCRKDMCAACGGKAGKNNVSEAVGNKIRKWAQPSWSSDVISYPTGICEPCRRALTDCEKMQSDDLPDRPGLTSRWRNFKLEQIEVPRGQLASSCSCPICFARKFNPISKMGAKVVAEKKQVMPKGQGEAHGITESKNTSCPHCFQATTGRGIPHVCNNASRKKNLSEIVMKEGVGAEQIVSKVLKNIVKDKGLESCDELRLKQLTGGNDLPVTLGKRKDLNQGVVDADIAAKIKKGLDLGKNETSKLLHILRKGKVKVESNLMDILEEVGLTLEDEYESVKMKFEESVKVESEDDKKKSNKKSKKHIVKSEVDVTIVKDIKGFVDKVIEARGLDQDNVKCRVVMDKGQGSLKIVLSVFDGDVDPDISFTSQEGKGEKLTGSNRLLVLAKVNGGQERYENVRLLLERLKLEKLPGLVLVGDLSIVNVYSGISGHGGKFACYVCEGESTLQPGTPRTFENLARRYEDYVAGGSNPKNMQLYKNVIHPCLVKGDPEQELGDVLPLPELHLLMGGGNWGYQLILKVWPPLLLWGRGKWTVTGRHGGTLDGANTNK